MKSLLNALQEGRLVELPDTDKDTALQFLVNLVAAIPDVGVDSGEMYDAVQARERTGNTGIGMGIACPHLRVPGTGELICAVGWSPEGIDYGSPDQKKVHLVILYYVPESHKSAYLKEVSALIQSVKKENGIAALSQADSIADVRNKLLDWVSAAIEAGLPQTRARMIRLEARQAATGEQVVTAPDGAKVQILPCSVLLLPDGKRFVLSANLELVAALESDDRLPGLLRTQDEFDLAGYRILRRTTTPYGTDRLFYECLAIKLN
jgi:nitrogen PTS system EIIA component